MGKAHLDTQWVQLAQEAKGAYKIKMRFDADGEAQKLALYHKDPAHQPDWIAAEVEARHPGAQILYWEKEWYEGDGDVVEVEFKTAEGVECELSFLADKTLKYTECPMALDALPEAARAALEAKVPGAEIDEVESKKGPKMDILSVKLKKEGRTHYLTMSPDGKILSHHLRLPASVDIPMP